MRNNTDRRVKQLFPGAQTISVIKLLGTV